MDLMALNRDTSPETAAALSERIAKLHSALQQVEDASAFDLKNWMLEDLVDAARWARTYVDLALAYKRYPAGLKDDHWKELAFVSEGHAREVMRDFSAQLPSAHSVSLGNEALRNLRSRLQGLTNVVQGWWSERTGETKQGS